MSFHVYIARPGLKEQPIPEDEWHAQIREYTSKSTAVALQEYINRKSGKMSASLHLRGKKREWLTLDAYGLGHAQNPSRELVEVMFDIAHALKASVYSERGKAYKSLEDWETRTKHYRERRDQARTEWKRQTVKARILWVAFIIVSMAAGFLIARYS